MFVLCEFVYGMEYFNVISIKFKRKINYKIYVSNKTSNNIMNLIYWPNILSTRKNRVVSSLNM